MNRYLTCKTTEIVAAYTQSLFITIGQAGPPVICLIIFNYLGCNKHVYGQANYQSIQMDLSQISQMHDPKKDFNLNSHNIATSTISNSHNSDHTNFCFLSPQGVLLTKRQYLIVCYVIATEQTEPGPSVRPFLDAVSKQLEAIIPETTSKSEEIFSDSDNPSYIPSAPPTPDRQRKRMGCARSTSQTIKSRTSRDEVSAKRKGKRQLREDTLKEENHQMRKRRETIDNFFYFLYFVRCYFFLSFFSYSLCSFSFPCTHFIYLINRLSLEVHISKYRQI